MEISNCVDFSVVNFLLKKIGRDVTYLIVLNVHKSVVKNAMIEKFGRGESRSARKRRANRLGRCHICGKFKHDDPCSSNQTESQHEFTVLFKSDPIRLYVEKSLNEKGYAYSRLVDNINLIRDKTKVLRI